MPSFLPFDVKRPSSTYSLIFTLAFLSFIVSILNKGNVNSLKRIGTIWDPWGILILTHSWSLIFPSSQSADVQLLKKEATHQIIVKWTVYTHSSFKSQVSVFMSNRLLISNASAKISSWTWNVFSGSWVNVAEVLTSDYQRVSPEYKELKSLYFNVKWAGCFIKTCTKTMPKYDIIAITCYERGSKQGCFSDMGNAHRVEFLKA